MTGIAMFRQSFKGRSKRDKKTGISAVEAKSESEYWHKGQETSIVSPARMDLVLIVILTHT